MDMEAREDKSESLKTSTPKIADVVITPSPATSPKKPIQLGVVQSSTGARLSSGNLGKKSRWDIAPVSGENEEESNQVKTESLEEPNVKCLIQKFEDISTSSALESDKTKESSNNKPGRVKLIRTNFMKSDNPLAASNIKKVIEHTQNEKNSVESGLKTISPSAEVTEVLSSSKALQIISSNYDSPSDESSQEAGDSTSSVIKIETPSDSAYASLEKLPDVIDTGEKPTIEERLKSSLSLSSSDEKESDNNKIENHDSITVIIPDTAEESEEGFLEKGKNKQMVTLDSFDKDINKRDSNLISENTETLEIVADEVASNKTEKQVIEHTTSTGVSDFGNQDINPCSSTKEEPENSVELLKSVLSDNTVITQVSTIEDLGGNNKELSEVLNNDGCTKEENRIQSSGNNKFPLSEINNVQVQLESVDLGSDSCSENDNKDIERKSHSDIKIETPSECVDEGGSRIPDLSSVLEEEITVEDKIGEIEKSSYINVSVSDASNLDQDELIDSAFVTNANLKDYSKSDIGETSKCIIEKSVDSSSNIDTENSNTLLETESETNPTIESKNSVSDVKLDSSEYIKNDSNIKKHNEKDELTTVVGESNAGVSEATEATRDVEDVKCSYIEAIDGTNIEEKQIFEGDEIHVACDRSENTSCLDEESTTCGINLKSKKLEESLSDESENSLQSNDKNTLVLNEDTGSKDIISNSASSATDIILISEESERDNINIHAVCEKYGNDDVSKAYNDGVDATMEQIFSDNLESSSEKLCSIEQNIEEELIPTTENELHEDKIIIEDTVCSENPSNLADPDGILETKDSLLKILESEGSPEACFQQKDTSVCETEVKTKSLEAVIIDTSNSEETDFINNDIVNDIMDSRTPSVETEAKNEGVSRFQGSNIVDEDESTLRAEVDKPSIITEENNVNNSTALSMKNLPSEENIGAECVNIKESVSLETAEKELVLGLDMKTEGLSSTKKEEVEMIPNQYFRSQEEGNRPLSEESENDAQEFSVGCSVEKTGEEVYKNVADKEIKYDVGLVDLGNVTALQSNQTITETDGDTKEPELDSFSGRTVGNITFDKEIEFSKLKSREVMSETENEESTSEKQCQEETRTTSQGDEHTTLLDDTFESFSVLEMHLEKESDLSVTDKVEEINANEELKVTIKEVENAPQDVISTASHISEVVEDQFKDQEEYPKNVETDIANFGISDVSAGEEMDVDGNVDSTADTRFTGVLNTSQMHDSKTSSPKEIKAEVLSSKVLGSEILKCDASSAELSSKIGDQTTSTTYSNDLCEDIVSLGPEGSNHEDNVDKGDKPEILLLEDSQDVLICSKSPDSENMETLKSKTDYKSDKNNAVPQTELNNSTFAIGSKDSGRTESTCVSDSAICSVDELQQKETVCKPEDLPVVKDSTADDTLSCPDSNSDNLNLSSDVQESLIEVRQQETIERSIDMLFEVPNSDELLKSNSMLSASSSKDSLFQVSSETKKLFSEEMHKEMLRMSPDNEGQCELKQSDSPKTENYSSLTEDLNSHNLPKSSTDNLSKAEPTFSNKEVFKLSNEENIDDPSCEGKTGNEIQSSITASFDESDVATIQAIDSFLEGDKDQSQKNKNYSEAVLVVDSSTDVMEQKCKKMTIDTTDLTSLFSNTVNEKEKLTAGNVLLHIEGVSGSKSSSTEKTQRTSDLSQPLAVNKSCKLPEENINKDTEYEPEHLRHKVSELSKENDSNFHSELDMTVSEGKDEEEISSVTETTFTNELCEEKSFETGVKQVVNDIVKGSQDSDFLSELPVTISEGKHQEVSSITETSITNELCEENSLETGVKQDVNEISKGSQDNDFLSELPVTISEGKDREVSSVTETSITTELCEEKSLETGVKPDVNDIAKESQNKNLSGTSENVSAPKADTELNNKLIVKPEPKIGIGLEETKSKEELSILEERQNENDDVIQESVCKSNESALKPENEEPKTPLKMKYCENQPTSVELPIVMNNEPFETDKSNSAAIEGQITVSNEFPHIGINQDSSQKVDTEMLEKTAIDVNEKNKDQQKEEKISVKQNEMPQHELVALQESIELCKNKPLKEFKPENINDKIVSCETEQKLADTPEILVGESQIQAADSRDLDIDFERLIPSNKVLSTEKVELETGLSENDRGESKPTSQHTLQTNTTEESCDKKEQNNSLQLKETLDIGKKIEACFEGSSTKVNKISKEKSLSSSEEKISALRKGTEEIVVHSPDVTIEEISISNNQTNKRPISSIEYNNDNTIDQNNASSSTTKSLKKFRKTPSSKELKSEVLNEVPIVKTDLSIEEKSTSHTDSTNQTLVAAASSVAEQTVKAASKVLTAKEVPAPVRVSARQKERQAAAAAALAAKEKTEAGKLPSQGLPKKCYVQEKQVDKRGKKSVSPTKELHVKTAAKALESGTQSPLANQKSPKILESKLNLASPKKIAKEVSQDKLEPITLKLSKEDNPVIVRSSSLSPKKNASPQSPQGKTLGYTLKIGKDSTTIIPKDSTSSPTRRESSPGPGSAKADLSGKVGYLIKDTGLTITPVAPSETQEQKLNKITLKLSKAGGHPEIKQEKSETWKAIRKLGEIDIVPVEGKTSADISKRNDKNDEGSPEKKLKLGDVTVEPSTSSSVSKLQGLLTQAPLNQSDSSEDGKFIGFGSPTEKLPQTQQQISYDIGLIRHDDSPLTPRKRGRPRKISSPSDIVHSVTHSLPPHLTAKDILAASLQHQTLQQHLQQSYQPAQIMPPEELDSSQPMFPVPLFDLSEDTFMDPSPPTIFPDQVQPDTIMRSARGRPIGRSRRPRGSGLMRGHERGGPRGRPRGSRGIKRILEEMEAMSYPDPDQPITLDNIDAEMGPRVPEHAASEKTMALLRKSIEGKKESLEKKARRSDGSEEGNSDIDAKVREMKEKIEAAYQAELKSPGKDAKKKTPEKFDIKEFSRKSPPELIPLNQKTDRDEIIRRKSADGKESVKRKLSEDKTEEGLKLISKRKSTEEETEHKGTIGNKQGEGSNTMYLNNVTDEGVVEDVQMEVDQTSEEPTVKEEKTEPEPPPKPVKPRPKSKAEIKRIKREKDRLRREAKKLAALEALKAPPPNPCEEDTRMSASDPNAEGVDGEGSGIKKNRMEVGDPEGKEFTVDQIAEYQWPLQGGELYMIQEQISTWLGVKSFQRKYPDLKRRRVEMEERTYLCDSGLVSESMCDLGLTAVSSSEVLDIMFQDFPEQYEELRKHMREKQARELINKQKERKKFEQTLSKSDLKEHAIQSLVSWNASLNKSRNEARRCHLDLQTWTIQYPKSKGAKMTRPTPKLGSYPVAVIPGQYADYYKRYTPQELRYFPVNTVLYGPLQPNERNSTGGSDGSQSESEDSSSSEGSSDSSSEGEEEGTEEEERECKTCGAKKVGQAMLQCSQCSHNIHVSCADLNPEMLAHVLKYPWQCSVCKTCQRCNNAKNESKMLFCDLCDRGYHSYCVGLRRVPAGSWTCELCASS